ncbi:hypothetical protein AVEN_261177-1 [Araneus ventricosus]|uniref:Uncharacterized protein n=1 Tax=Araneus ventricosus TaxID=182803 RepID=A0A4Y2JI87_ARAVE|nr:hypothetical protein AVEN_261177-1 [Araneus ventricosus]
MMERDLPKRRRDREENNRWKSRGTKRLVPRKRFYCHDYTGLMKLFVKSLAKDEECFKYICSKFPELSETKLKEGIFVGIDVLKLLFDVSFTDTMNEIEKEVLEAFKDVVHRFITEDGTLL